MNRDLFIILFKTLDCFRIYKLFMYTFSKNALFINAIIREIVAFTAILFYNILYA